MKCPRYLVVATLLLISGVGYNVYSAWTANRTGVNAGPRINCPDQIDLGEHEVGDQITTSFELANSGDTELCVTEIHANCSCSGLEREDGKGRFTRADSIRIPAGESMKVRLRVTARGVPGGPVQNIVEFRTNDPARPAGQVRATISKLHAGITTVPNAVYVGTVSAGTPVQQMLEVRDTHVPPRAVAEVTSTCPGRVAARLLPPDAGSSVSVKPGLEKAAGIPIGRIEVTILTGSPGSLESAVVVRLADQSCKPHEVRVIGRVAEAVDVSPSSLLLPMNSGQGPVYRGRCMCRSTDGKPLTLTIDPTPPGLTAEVTASREDVQVVQVTWQPSSDSGVQHHRVRVRAKVGERDAVFEIPVVCRHGGS